MRVTFGVLGPVTAWDDAGEPIALKGPRHRAVLARLIAANGRVVPVGDLVTDLWVAPPAGAIAAVRTFVAALRRAIEPARTARTPARMLVTDGPGYALRAARDTVDAWRFEDAARTATTENDLSAALSWWRGPAYAEFAGEPWTGAVRARLAELRLHATERLAEARLTAGRPAEAVPDLDAHVTEHPWREDGWRLLALALYRSGRQADALAVLRRARTLLTGRLGLDPSPELRKLEADILRQDAGLTPDRLWSELTADYDRIVAARKRLDSTAGLLRTLAVSGGLAAARKHRTATIAAAEELGDPDLTARVVGAYDVPAIWLRSDDPEQAATVVAAAERALAAATAPVTRARLLATIAVESRGRPGDRPVAAAREAERIARDLDDPALLAFALNGAFMQSAHATGRSAERDAIGAELVGLAARHGLTTAEVLGHLIRMQAAAARAGFPAADQHAAAADDLAAEHELPLVAVFTGWYRALRVSWHDPAAGEAAYRRAAVLLDGAGMPGLDRGLLPLALLTNRVRGDRPVLDEHDWGPYEPWARPLVELGAGRPAAAAKALHDLPDPPPDLLTEAMWALAAHAAIRLGDPDTSARAKVALAPAAGELAGAGSGLVTLGPVDDLLAGTPL